MEKYLLKSLLALVLMLISGSVWGIENTVTWTATNGGLGTNNATYAGVTGTIKTGDFEWSYTRKLFSGESNVGWTSKCIQLGKNGGIEHIEFSTTNIPGTIKEVAIECSSYNGLHKVAISVGGVSYLDATPTAKWTTVSTLMGEGTSSGEIVISITDGGRALYIKSISVTYVDETSTTVSVSSYEYATASFNANVVIPDGTTVYTVTGVSEDAVQMEALSAGDVLKANVGVLVYKEGGGDVTFDYTDNEVTVASSLLYTYGTIKTTDYILGTYEGGFGFCHPSEEIECINGKAYLPLKNVGGGASAPFLRIGGTTNITNVKLTEENVFYDLTGRKIEQPERGIYIVNGKKEQVK
ncbi:MAG: hypothetical protein IKH59_10015 [Bacteroidaceae bacterium]|jgi:hypothetical protein|nr:hypothetical protein [Bacteroidaceae bacterium]